MAERASGALRDRFLEKHETLTRQIEVVRSLLLGAETLAPELEGKADHP